MDIKQSIDDFNERWPNARFGGGHIVLDDDNFDDDEFIDYCLKCLRDPRYEGNQGHSPEEIEATIAFLVQLRDVPLAERQAVYGEADDVL